MSNLITDCCGQIKAIAEATEGTPTQKLLAILAFVGVEKTADLMRITGLKERAIQTAKRTVLRPAMECATQQYTAVDPQQNAPTPQPIAVSPAVHCATPHSVAGRARVEDNNIITNLEPTVVEVKCSEVSLLRADAPKPKKQVHGTRLDPNWELSEDLRQWTRTRFPQTTDQRLADELETFRDYWIAVPGQRGRKLDWDATWRTWSKRAFATAPIRPRAADGERPVSSWEAEKAAKHARIRALMESVGGSA